MLFFKWIILLGKQCAIFYSYKEFSIQRKEKRYYKRPITSRLPREAFQDVNNPGGELFKAILKVSSAVNMKTS